METNELASPHGDPALRRVGVVLRRWMPWILAASLVAGLLGFLFLGGTDRYRSEGVVELTDDVAVGISSTGTRRGDARVEIEAQRRLLTSADVLPIVAAQVDSGEVVSIDTESPDDSPVIVVGVEASTEQAASDGVAATLDWYIGERERLAREDLQEEIGTLEEQRLEQQGIVDQIVDELEAARVTGTADDVSVLENRAAAALERLTDFDVAIQEREFFLRTLDGRARIVESAGEVTSASTSSAARGVQLFLLVLFLGTGIVVVVSRIRGRLLLLDEVRTVAGSRTPVLATVPRFSRNVRRVSPTIVVGRAGAEREAESFRYARSAIEVASGSARPVTVLLTSAGANEGKTVTACNLAAAAAAGGRKTTLIDGDLLNPSVGATFGEPNRTSGLRPLLEDPSQLSDMPLLRPSENLTVVAVPRSSNAAAARAEVSVEGVEAALAAASQGQDLVIVDAPPVLAVSDSMVLARAVDVVVLVVRMGTTSRRDLDTALTQLRQGGVNLAGVVATHATDRRESYYGYGYDYRGTAEANS